MFAIPPAQLPQLQAIAHRVAAGNGDARPVWIRITADRHEHAERALMAMRGRFVANGVSRPPGAKAPHGNTIVVILGRKTLRDLDFAIGTNLPVSKLHGWQPLR